MRREAKIMDGSVLADFHTTEHSLAVWFVFQAVCASRWTRCVGHVAGAGEEKCIQIGIN
jgi:hypothetical protein